MTDTLTGVSFHPGRAERDAASGVGAVDYRLQRRRTLADFRSGKVAPSEVCDAHPELIRAARNVGTETQTTCPICEETELRLVTYVFGHGIGPQGRCVSTAKEMRSLNASAQDLNAYVVEACTECRWHHLLRVLPIGGRR